MPTLQISGGYIARVEGTLGSLHSIGSVKPGRMPIAPELIRGVAQGKTILALDSGSRLLFEQLGWVNGIQDSAFLGQVKIEEQELNFDTKAHGLKLAKIAKYFACLCTAARVQVFTKREKT